MLEIVEKKGDDFAVGIYSCEPIKLHGEFGNRAKKERLREMKITNGLPSKQGLYDPQFEHDACGIGFVAHMKGKPSHEIVTQALTVLYNLDHRGGQGSEANTGDGAGILLQIPHSFFCRRGG